MKNRIYIIITALTLCLPMAAKNKVVTIGQVTTAVTLVEDVDYTITDTTPFISGGSVDIKNTEHATLIFKNIRPTKALQYLNFVLIDGAAAVQNENCQVKMYGTGAIIMPYGKNFKPLTVYSEQGFKGDSCNTFGLEHSGGYMNTMTTAKLNNRVRSFKLKRGYMVTFSTSPAGRGYSRCFIADDADLEFSTLPEVLDECISSYRVFKWNDAQKKGFANIHDATNVPGILNCSWAYHSWTNGQDLGPDVECVPHHYKETWPPIGDCGSVSYSPHLKTNNEPANSADEEPATVEECLANWENLMRTGMRLCSPSSHDGGLTWLRTFMEEIDKRGWRCDILDMHGYWATGTYNTLQNWYNDYKRPIWLSEFLWGASWNKNGIFGATSDWDTYSTENQKKNYDGMKPILDNLNNWEYVERYAYWNGERNCSKLYNGSLSLLGEYYKNMDTGLGYKKAYEFVPKVVCVAPGELTGTFDKSDLELSVNWTSSNGEKTKTMILEQRLDDGEWTVIQEYPRTEETSFSYTITFPEEFELGIYNYRVRCNDIDGVERMTNEFALSLTGTDGLENLQYGRVETNNSDQQIAYFNPPSSGDPAIIMGLISNNNYITGENYYGIVPCLQSIRSQNINFRLFPWNAGSSYMQNFTEMEHCDFMMFTIGDHQYGDVQLKAGKSSSKIKNDSTWVAFSTPFPEGVIPVVVASVITGFDYYPYSVKIWGITNEGFAAKVCRQEALSESYATYPSQHIYYVAATPGSATLENGKILTVGQNSTDCVDGRNSKGRKVDFVNTSGEGIGVCNPYILCGPQTNNYDCNSIYRIVNRNTEEQVINGMTYTMTTSLHILRQKDLTSTIEGTDYYKQNGDCIGWIMVSDPTDGTGISAIKKENDNLKVVVKNRRIIVEDGIPYAIFNIEGKQVNCNEPQKTGIYIVKAGKKSKKIFVK